jgi:hypothetical protein
MLVTVRSGATMNKTQQVASLMDSAQHQVVRENQRERVVG